MPEPTIGASVGEDGTNRVADVRTVQRLLRQLPALVGALDVTGQCDERTIQAIHTVQRELFKRSDGLLKPNGPTFKRLRAAIDTGFVQLPQREPNDDSADYYSYSEARCQYGAPATIQALQDVARALRSGPMALRIGIGDISFIDGHDMPPHKSHRRGKNTDIRPMRTDRRKTGVDIRDPAYDREATRAVVHALFASGRVAKVLFNDSAVEDVTFFQGHHNHLHVDTKA
jgi:penicillin-insensitive murein endopeptidase